MKKSILALFAMVALVATSGYAQGRSINVYVDTFSGHLTQTPGWENDGSTGAPRTFSEACAEVGVGYSQSFENGFGVSANVVIYNPMNGEGGNLDQKTFYFTQYLSAQLKATYSVAGFGTYVEFNASGRADLGASYGLGLGSAGNLSFGTDFELNPFAGYKTNDDGDYTTGVHGILGLFQIYAEYSIPFAERWAYSTKLMFRWGNDFDMDAFSDSLAIRWENKVAYQANDSVGLWAQVRYQAVDVAVKDADVDNQLFLQAGVSYKYDLQ